MTRLQSEDWAAGPDLPAPVGPADIAEAGATPAARAHALSTAEALVARAPDALALIDAMLADLRTRATAPTDTAPAIFDLADMGEAGLTLLDQVLGRGEVSGTVREPDGAVVSVQESVFTGIWRLTRRAPCGATRARWIEIGPVPAAVGRAATAGRPADTLDPATAPAETMAAAPLLTEIAEQAARHAPGQANHVLTLSLLPVTEADLAHLRAALGPGPVSLRSRGYGTCDIEATGIAGVWSVRFLNASDTVILETLEIGDVPAAARAAPEDFADAAGRLADTRNAYF
jgi:hydrogenase-1 operon protein HyaF